MTIDNVRCNGANLGAFVKGNHGAVNALDAYGKQRGLTSAYFVEGDRDAAHPVIDFILAYVGNDGDIRPIGTLEFDVVDNTGSISQHVIMRKCVVTAWSLVSPVQPKNHDNQPARPDVEHVRIESVDVQIHAGPDTKTFVRTDPNQAR